ncbi:MAG: hypothetical protein Q4G16_03615 [Cruoricaptor ignavus]|nr:hypothetical protein [Cruoricaptor ignavus]
MKKLALVALSATFMVACNSNKNENAEQQTEEKPIGLAEDSHGCNGAAGETWSELKQDCIQVFNVGTRLNPVQQNENDAVISAFAIVDADKNKAEIFLAEREHTIILDKSEDGTFQNDDYKYDDEKGILYINGEEKFVKEK